MGNAPPPPGDTQVRSDAGSSSTSAVDDAGSASDDANPFVRTGLEHTIPCVPVQGPKPLLSAPLPSTDWYGNIAADGQYVYFAGTNGFYRVAASGGDLETLYSGPFTGHFAENTEVYAWLLTGDGGYPSAVVVRDIVGQGVVPLPPGATIGALDIVADPQGDVFFQVVPPAGGAPQVWRWASATRTAAEMPGVGRPDLGGLTNLYFVDRGQIVWSNEVAGPTAGIYATDIATGTPHQLTTSMTNGFGSIIGADATNVYGVDSVCSKGACPFTVWAAPRAGGAPVFAYQSSASYWLNGIYASDSGLYWMDWVTTAIYRAPIPSSAAPSVAARPNVAINAFAMDDCNLYWLDVNGGGASQQVMATAK